MQHMRAVPIRASADQPLPSAASTSAEDSGPAPPRQPPIANARPSGSATIAGSWRASTISGSGAHPPPPPGR